MVWALGMKWWRHQMETFSALLAICAGNSPVPGEFPAQRPVTHSFDVFFDLRLNKRLSKQTWGWWFEMPPWSLWRQCNESKGWGIKSSSSPVSKTWTLSPEHLSVSHKMNDIAYVHLTFQMLTLRIKISMSELNAGFLDVLCRKEPL